MKIVLASKSPRRQELIKGLELDYRIVTYEVDESFDSSLPPGRIAESLAEKKAMHFPDNLQTDEILLTADTLVYIQGQVLNKPENEEEALQMLNFLTGNTHEVYTGVCLSSNNKKVSFHEKSEVTCKPLTHEEKMHYIQRYKPFDKAGSYGIQDWFGYTAVEKINGCFYNVMGLPVSRVYEMLKKEFQLVLCLLFISFLGFAQSNNKPENLKVQLNGVLPGKVGQAMVQYFATPFENDPKQAPFTINDNGSFSVSFDILEGQMIAFVHSTDFFRIYVKPGDNLTITAENSKTDKLKFEGKGKNEAEYSYHYFQYFKNSSEGQGFQKLIADQLGAKGPEAFKQWTDSLAKTKLNYLEKFGKNLLPEVKQQLKADYQFEMENLKMTYPQYYQNRQRSNPNLPPLDTNYYNYVSKLNTNDPNALGSAQYRTFLKFYLIRELTRGGQRMEITEIWDICQRYFDQKILPTFRMYIWADIITNGQTSDATTLYPLAKKECSSVYGFKQLEDIYLDMLPFEPGSKAFPFIMKDSEGKIVSLEQFKGKVVYLDFWASWCRPCLGEIPAGEELKKHFAGKDVVFINISIDEAEDKWIAARNRYNISGIHLISNNRNSPEVQKKYKVQSIPSYFLIDKNGNFLSAPAPRPSNPGIKDLIEKALTNP